MSDQPTNPPTPAPSRATIWRRRLFRAALIIVILVLLIRIGLTLLLGSVLRQVAGIYDLDISYQRQELTLLGGDAGLWFVTIKPKGSDKPLLQADYVRGNLSVLELLRGRLYFWRLEADGVVAHVDRNAEGKLPAIEHLLSQFATTPATPAVPTTSSATADELDLSSPFKVDAVRLQRMRLILRDEAVAPTFESTVILTARISDLQKPDVPTRFEVELWSDPLLDLIRIEGTGTSSKRIVEATATARMHGLRLSPIAAYLRPLGFNPVTRNLDGKATLEIKTKPGPKPDSVAAVINLRQIEATDESATIVNIADIQINANAISSTQADIGSIVMSDASVVAQRTSSGRLRFAGIELAEATESPTTTRPSTSRAIPTASPMTAPAVVPSARYLFSLGSMRLKNASARLDDSFLSPMHQAGVVLDELTLAQQPLDGKPVMTIDARLHAPDAAGAIRIEGIARPFESPYSASLDIRGERLTLKALKPYLDMVGLTPTFSDGKASLKLVADAAPTDTGGLVANLALTDILVSDGDSSIQLQSLRIANAGIEPVGELVKLGTIEIVGPHVQFSHESDGTFRTTGLRFDPAAIAKPSSSTSTPPASIPAVPIALPSILLDRLSWTGSNLRLEDRAVDPPIVFELLDVSAEVVNVLVPFAANPPTVPDGSIRFNASVPGVIEAIRVNGSLQNSALTSTSALVVDVAGINLVPIRPYLEPLGLIPELTDGNLTLSADAKLDTTSSRLKASLAMRDLSLRSGNESLLTVGRLDVDDVTYASDGLAARRVSIAGPTLSLGRRSDGAVAFAGLLLPMRSTPTAVTEASSPTTQPAIVLPVLPIDLRCDDFLLSDASLNWMDDAARTPVRLALDVDGSANSVHVGANATPGRFKFDLKAADVLNASIQCNATLDPRAVSMDGTFVLDQMTLKRIAGYLPVGLDPLFVDGRCGGSFSLSLATETDHSQSVSVTARDVELSDAGRTLARLPAFELIVPRVDLAAQIIDCSVLTVSGVEASATFRESGLDVLGFRLTAPPSSPIKTDGTIELNTNTRQTSDVGALLASARATVPLIRIASLDLKVASLSLADAGRPDAAPIALTALRLSNVSPIELAGPAAADNAPIELSLTSQVTPLIDRMTARISLTPFAVEPRLSLDVAGESVRGEGVVALLPELRSNFNGSALTAGSFQTRIDATLRLDRRSPTDFDLSRGFGANVVVGESSYRVAPGEPPVVGIGGATIDGVDISPGFAGGSIKSVEIIRPTFKVHRDTAGVHLLGLILNLPAPATRPVDAVVEAAADTVSDATPPEPRIAPTPYKGPPYKLDKLLVSGADILIEDRVGTPVARIPINALDIEVRGLSTQMLAEPKAARFNLLVGAGDVELQQAKDPMQLDTRPLFAQFSASGRVAIFPFLDGYAKASLGGTELRAFKGVAQQLGITLNDGVFDAEIDARFKDGGNLDLRNRLVFTNLSLSEPPDGPLARLLKLKTPIDAAIGLAEDAGGSISMPIHVPIEAGELSVGKAAMSVVGGVSEVLAKAILRATAKLLGALGGEKDAGPDANPTISIDFDPADASLDDADLNQIKALANLLRKDKSATVTLTAELSTDDIARIGVRSNPDAGQLDTLTESYRRQRADLLDRRDRVAAEAQGRLAAGDQSGADDLLTQLRRLQDQIGENEAALDEMYDLMRPGADRQIDRRTKIAALDLARARMTVIRDQLLATRLPDIATRLAVQNPKFIDTGNARVTATIVSTQAKKKGLLSIIGR